MIRVGVRTIASIDCCSGHNLLTRISLVGNATRKPRTHSSTSTNVRTPSSVFYKKEYAPRRTRALAATARLEKIPAMLERPRCCAGRLTCLCGLARRRAEPDARLATHG
jgi:hypothetical protein